MQSRRRLRIYLAAVGAALLGQGSLSLLLDEGLNVNLAPLHGLLTTDDRHAGLHVVWGLVLLAFAALAVHPPVLIGLGCAFGAFYTALGVIGLFDKAAFGLHLGWGENAFHLLVGPLALMLAWLAGLEEMRVRTPSPRPGELRPG
jgi:hypothetical protein